MKRRGKRIIWTLVGLVAAAGLGAGVLAYLALHTPSWMQGMTVLTPEQRTEAAQRAENRLLQTREFAAAAVAAERQGEAPASPVSADSGASGGGSESPRSLPPTPPPDARRVEFTQDEINALVGKWGEFRDWKRDYERFVTDPTVILRADRVILAARLRGFGDAVTSVHLRPEATPDGRVRLTLDQVVLGSLPVPQTMYHERFGAIAERVRRRLPDFQKQAEISRDGVMNAAGLASAVGRMALDGLDTMSAEVPLILPMVTEPGGVPMRVVDLQVQQGKVVVDVTPMNPQQRREVLEFVQGRPASTP